ncbi:MAG: hypothetical protein KBD25_00595 [Rickettsiaceae bacterium]|nr:hypothetical protein [Rickettsiaceae bacterium]
MLNLTEQERAQYWHSHISNFIASKKTQKQYCKDNDISYNKFKGWRYKFSNEFPPDEEHPKVKQKRAQILNTTAIPVEPKTNKFAAVDIIDIGVDKQPATPLIKLFLNKNIYLELPDEIAVKNLQKIFSALGVLNVSA